MTALGAQIAALPIGKDKKGRIKILMITSRDTGRWVLPKGWTMKGKTHWAAAKIEALEEAGAVGYVADESIGFYHYDKVLDNSDRLPCRVHVYPMMIDRLRRNWKERGQRKRRWFTPKSAAKRVDEPELAALLRSFIDKPHRQPVVGPLLKRK